MPEEIAEIFGKFYKVELGADGWSFEASGFVQQWRRDENNEIVVCLENGFDHKYWVGLKTLLERGKRE